MPDHERIAEGFRRLHELFGSPDGDESVPNRRCRRYVLEIAGDKPVFRLADNDRGQPRSELELMLDQIVEEEFGDDIVPRKFARLFPG